MAFIIKFRYLFRMDQNYNDDAAGKRVELRDFQKGFTHNFCVFLRNEFGNRAKPDDCGPGSFAPCANSPADIRSQKINHNKSRR